LKNILYFTGVCINNADLEVENLVKKSLNMKQILLPVGSLGFTRLCIHAGSTPEAFSKPKSQILRCFRYKNALNRREILVISLRAALGMYHFFEFYRLIRIACIGTTFRYSCLNRVARRAGTPRFFWLARFLERQSFHNLEDDVIRVRIGWQSL
jgi:hypothetical protein